MNRAPFAVLALPRSRTAWLSALLSYGDRRCDHEPSARFGGVEDLAAYFQSGAGCTDTMLALRWTDIVRAAPDVRLAIVHRGVHDVRQAIRRRGYGSLEVDRVCGEINRALNKAAKWRGAIAVQYRELENPATVKRVFEHCLRVPFDREWFETWRDVNVQADEADMARIVEANNRGIMALYGSTLER